MHYYGTYAMARAAGITRNAAKVIAVAAQFVDDNAAKESIKSGTGAAWMLRPRPITQWIERTSIWRIRGESGCPFTFFRETMEKTLPSDWCAKKTVKSPVR